jgi:predicted pyridoxine 5'-phosphate oxidase superfamily flavin-nucleotide-binding protein
MAPCCHRTAPNAAVRCASWRHGTGSTSRRKLIATTLSNKAKALLERPVIVTVATVDSDGRPQVTPGWIDLDRGDLVFNTAKGRV